MKVLVLVSGGIDSTTCLALAADKYGKENVSALSMYYGQKHYKELECAKKVAKYYGADYMELNLSSIFAESNCSLLSHSSEDIPKESYAEQLNKRDGIPVSTYVPFRNGLFLASAASIALSKEMWLQRVLNWVSRMNLRGAAMRGIKNRAACAQHASTGRGHLKKMELPTH